MKKIINAFSEGIFQYIDGFQVEKESGEESTSENDEMDSTIMPELESEEFAEQRTTTKRLKNFNTKSNT